MFGFAISSLFSSFSFRAVQNGLVFSIIFGIAIRYLQKYSTVKPTAGNALVSPRILAMTSLVLTLLMVLAAGRMGISRVYQRSAEHTADINVRMRLLERSLAWDNENAASYSEYSAAKASLGAFDDAAASLRSCIDNGAASTEIYSSLAELYSYAGDRTAARSTIAEAVSIYPRSVFARVRYAQIAEQNGDNDVAGQELAKARELDRKQANGWVVLLRDGDLAAFNEARGSNDVAEPSELLPAGAVLRYIDKTSFVASSK
jgi:tetratricopeptide (TPR) repeat protein